MAPVRRSSTCDSPQMYSARAHRIAIGALAALACFAGRVRAGDERPSDAYEIVVVTAIAALPEPLRSTFDPHRDELIRLALSHSVAPVSPVREVDRHFVVLDVGAKKGSDPAARIEMSRLLPRDRKAAEALAREKDLARLGSLPWTLHAHYAALVEAFRAKDDALVATESGALLHFVTDASMPLFVVKKRSSRSRGRFFNRPVEPDPAAARQRILEAVAKLKPRLAYEVRVSPTRYRELDEPIDVVFETLLASFAEDVRFDGGDLSAMTESRLETAALLGANLIGTAWNRAGRPPLVTQSAAGAKPSEPAPATASPNAPAAADDAGFVGSRSSKTYHRSTCSHAKRIKPENMVAFSAPKVAVAAGRKPCKTCKPGGGN